MSGNLALSRRRFLQRLAAVTALPAVLAACSDADEPDPSATPTSIPEPTTPPEPSATPIPDLGLVNTVDANSLDRLRSEELNGAGHYDAVRVSAEGVRHLIPLEAVEWGGVAKDGIPSLDAPSYVGPERWSQMVYDPDGLVVGVEVNGKQRAYPLQILIWHEIVNETFDGKHLLVTY